MLIAYFGSGPGRAITPLAHTPLTTTLSPHCQLSFDTKNSNFFGAGWFPTYYCQLHDHMIIQTICHNIIDSIPTQNIMASVADCIGNDHGVADSSDFSFGLAYSISLFPVTKSNTRTHAHARTHIHGMHAHACIAMNYSILSSRPEELPQLAMCRPVHYTLPFSFCHYVDWLLQLIFDSCITNMLLHLRKPCTCASP